ncbi:MAG: hypothetical protein JO257_03350 [Deltaproteobacteria bacterium]|nr:hypothetical protein [Deltaproteobacteria bacterium]
MRLSALVCLLATACGGANADQPLTIPLGLTHKQAEAQLHAHQFCHAQGQLPQTQEMYPRCDRTASELGDAWVTATFDGDRLVELRRWERYGDDDHAVARWNELIAARSKTSTPSDEALEALKEKGVAEPGTKTVKAFRDKDGTVVGIYLLTPQPPQNANVLEKITYTK